LLLFEELKDGKIGRVFREQWKEKGN
jgi:hypothetical protein